MRLIKSLFGKKETVQEVKQKEIKAPVGEIDVKTKNNKLASAKFDILQEIKKKEKQYDFHVNQQKIISSQIKELRAKMAETQAKMIN